MADPVVQTSRSPDEKEKILAELLARERDDWVIS
jgi:hypothetical protein